MIFTNKICITKNVKRKFRNRYLQQMSKLYNYNRNIIKISMNILGALIEQYKKYHRKIGKNVN